MSMIDNPSRTIPPRDAFLSEIALDAAAADSALSPPMASSGALLFAQAKATPAVVDQVPAPVFPLQLPSQANKPITIPPGLYGAPGAAGVNDVASMRPADQMERVRLLPDLASDALGKVFGQPELQALTPLERASRQDAVALLIMEDSDGTPRGMRTAATALAGRPSVRDDVTSLATRLMARDIAEQVLTSRLPQETLKASPPDALGMARQKIADRLVAEGGDTEQGMRVIAGRINPRDVFLEASVETQESPIRLRNSLEVSPQVVVDGIRYGRNRIDAAPQPNEFPLLSPDIQVESRDPRALPVLKPRQNNPDQPVLNFVNDKVLQNPIVKAALAKVGIDKVFVVESGLRVGVTGLGSQTRQFVEIDPLINLLKAGLGDIANAVKAGEPADIRAAAANLARQLTISSDQAFRPGRGTLAEIFQAPVVTQGLQLGLGIVPGLIDPNLPSFPAEGAKS
jgi:hypothetical protein